MTKFVFEGFPFVCAVIGYFTFIRPARLGAFGKSFWLMFFLLGSLKFVLFETLGGRSFSPELPELMIWTLNFVNVVVYVLVTLSLFWWTRRGRRVVLPAVAVALAAWGLWEAFRVPAVKEVELTFKNLPAELDGYRILQISDLHCSSAARAWRTRAVVNVANAAKADLICLTGDYVDGRVAHRAEDMRPLKELRARDGVWCVTGNHEFYLDGPRWEKWYRENGFRFLVNDCVHPQPRLALAGVNDPVVESFGGYRDGLSDVAAAFRESRLGDFRVLLSHRPKAFRENVQAHGVDLQLSGHTHGGFAPVLDWLVALLNGGFVRGLYREGDAQLYVNPGSGQWAGLPLRFLDASEITVFTLRRWHLTR